MFELKRMTKKEWDEHIKQVFNIDNNLPKIVMDCVEDSAITIHAYSDGMVIYVSQELYDLIQDIDDQAFRRGQLSVYED